MSETKKCLKCGIELPSDAPGGHCPQCLLQLGLGIENTAVVPIVEKPGDRIGRYKLLQQIGEGGCGVVYMAEQDEPVRRRVALKIIKLGMDTKTVIARFEAERQVLALMDHPNIAKVFDASATDTGRPYFVMELVRGIKITDYCDRQKLSIRQRLDLFIQVCQAIQHAHQKGVIHRDIKPSNVLVTEQDGVAVPKIIDFGIAKATTAQRLTDKTLFTAFEQFIGTPAYMSPEQAGLGGLDIDTRSDIYSLGVLLYELLTGHQPFDSAELHRAALDEILRTLRDKEPPRPSARLTTLTEQELTFVAERHQAAPAKLSSLLRGDLDWIVMKALNKDRCRRYETANGFAADIKRHLNNESILARPPSNLYRFQKLVRRNRPAFAAATLIVLSLLVGTHWEQTHRMLVHLYQLVKSPEAVIAEVNFKDKQPEFYSAFSYDGVRGNVTSPAVEESRSGLGGGNALVARFDSSIFTNRDFGFAGFVAMIGVSANAATWVNTTNLGGYKLYVTAKTTGLAGNQSHGRVIWQFITPAGPILSMAAPVAFTTNYQVYSFVLADGYMDAYSGGSWNEFTAHFHEIDGIQCELNADNWRGDYRTDRDAAFYVSNVRFVRLTRAAKRTEATSPAPTARDVEPSIQIQPLGQTVNEGAGASFSVLATGTAPQSCQWRRGTNVLIGETNTTLTLRNLTPTEAGNYSVLITNTFGAVTSSNALLTVLKVREVPISEVNFLNKRPLHFGVYSYSENPVLLPSNARIVPDAGVSGGPALVASVNGSSFTNQMNQRYAGFGAVVTVAADGRSGIDTTNLGSYKLYVTARTTGVKRASSYGRVQWWFLTPRGNILTMDSFATFTTNYQTYSFVLNDESVDPNDGGSMSDFLRHFNEIDQIQCVVNADNLLNEYRLDTDDAFYISHVKFVRLVPADDSAPAKTGNNP